VPGLAILKYLHLEASGICPRPTPTTSPCASAAASAALANVRSGARDARHDQFRGRHRAAYPPLWINEVQPDNPDGLTDNTGQPQPWVELFNSGTNAHSLA
jgi:hypothetical protein